MKEHNEQDSTTSGSKSKRIEGEALRARAADLGSDWEIIDERRLRRTYRFDDFVGALAYVNRVGTMAEEQNHHPDLQLSYGRVVVEVWTHTADGLTDKDFVFAGKAEALR